LSRRRNKKTKKKRKRRPTVVGRVVTNDARFWSVTESSLNTLRDAEATLATAVSEKNTNLTQVVNDSVKNAIGVVANNIKDTVEKDVTTTVQKEVLLKMAVVTSRHHQARRGGDHDQRNRHGHRGAPHQPEQRPEHGARPGNAHELQPVHHRYLGEKQPPHDQRVGNLLRRLLTRHGEEIAQTRVSPKERVKAGHLDERLHELHGPVQGDKVRRKQ
jgi:hypothetical protein